MVVIILLSDMATKSFTHNVPIMGLKSFSCIMSVNFQESFIKIHTKQ